MDKFASIHIQQQQRRARSRKLFFIKRKKLLSVASLFLLSACIIQGQETLPNEQVCSDISTLRTYIHDNRHKIDNAERVQHRIAPLATVFCRSGIQAVLSTDIGATSEDFKELAHDMVISTANSPPEYETAVFKCIADFTRCSDHLRLTMTSTSAELSCGVSYVACVVSNIVPFAGR